MGVTTEGPRVSGRFATGFRHSPSTEFKRGKRHSPATEFRAGQEAHNKMPVGSVRERREANTGLMRAWVKVAEPNVWRKRAVVVWEAFNGPLPRGHLVHHKDRDSLNDHPFNLVALTRKAHAAEHRNELQAWRG